MGRHVAVRTLNQQTSAVLAEVAQGQEITITKAGRPIARLVPIQAGALDELIRAGVVVPATVTGPVSLPPPSGDGIDVAAALVRDREQERW